MSHIEEIPPTFKRKFHRATDEKYVTFYLPEEVSEHLGLKENGEVGFKRIKYKGRNYVLITLVTTEI